MTATGPVARVDLDTIYAELAALRLTVVQLQADLPHHVSFTKAKQDEYEDRLINHGTRLGDLEHRVTRLEAQQKPAAPWYSVVGAVGTIIAAVVTVATVLTLNP